MAQAGGPNRAHPDTAEYLEKHGLQVFFAEVGDILCFQGAMEVKGGGWASAAHSNFRDNVFLNMSRKICLLTSYHPAAVRETTPLRSLALGSQGSM